MLRERGFEASVMPVPAAPPAVFAERKAASSDRTLIFYNHYDVQPAEPLELWDSPPFEPEIREGKLFARGAIDDKGHIACRLAAIDAVLAESGDLPCNIKFLIEGGEEIASPGLPTFVENWICSPPTRASGSSAAWTTTGGPVLHSVCGVFAMWSCAYAPPRGTPTPAWEARSFPTRHGGSCGLSPR
ncbi:MAG: M20/M25/M40 family metallo-hydrolase, partial [Chloroflexia bacterium]